MPFARRRGALFPIGAVLLLVSGCAAPGSRIAEAYARDGASAPRVSRELIGTWHGTYGQIGELVWTGRDEGRAGRAKNSLYGVTVDPLVEATIMIDFEREPSAAAGSGGTAE